MSDALSMILDHFAECRVLCVGDVMLDRFVYGQVDRISPEAPIPVFSIREERSMLGGAGNVARNLVALGGRTTFVAVTGNDKTGHEITSLIGKESLISPFLIPESGRLSTVKTRYVAGNQQVLRADHEVAAPVAEATAQRVAEAALSELAAQDVVVLSDYGKGVLTRATVEAIITAAREQGKPVIVDPKSRDFSLYRGATCISPNLHELANASSIELRSDEDVIGAAGALIDQHDLQCMLVTRSSKGMTLVMKNGEVHNIPARAQEVYDVSGAGDTAVAALALGIASGLSFDDAAYLSNLAAGIVVGRLGTAVATMQDIKNALSAKHELTGAYKIMPLATAALQAEQWKREGKTVAFTNGCFDLLHHGHLSILNFCKKHSDKLIVGVNTDASIKRLKGPNRPVNEEHDRTMLLASLAVVDAVVLFEEDTPLKLIESVRPQVLVKGADYQKHQVVGHEFVESYGGRVELAPLKQGYSTTNTIKKMA